MSKTFYKIYAFLPAVVLIAGITVSFLSWGVIGHLNDERSQVTFETDAQKMADSINSRIRRDVYLLNSVQGFYTASDQVDRDEFKTFLDSVELSVYYPGISDLYYFSYVDSADLPNFVSRVQQDTSLNSIGYPDFAVWPETDSLEHLVLTFAYPEALEVKTMGFDFLSDPIRNKISQEVMSSGEILGTPQIILVGENSPGLNIIAPVYKNNLIQGQENLSGFLVASIEVERFFSVVVNSGDLDVWNNFDLEIFDKTPENLFEVDHEEEGEDTTYVYDFDGADYEAEVDNRVILKSIDVAGQNWTLKISANKDYGIDPLDKILSFAILFGGLLTTFLLVFVISLLVRSRRRALDLAQKITRDLRESEQKFRLVFQELADAVFIHDFSGRFLMVNSAACKHLGYSEKELLKLSPDKIDAPEFVVLAPERLAKIKEEKYTAFENVHIAKDGKKIPVEVSNSLIDFQGKPAILSVVRDVTDRKKREEEIRERTEELERLNKNMVGRELKMIELKDELARIKNKKKS